MNDRTWGKRPVVKVRLDQDQYAALCRSVLAIGTRRKEAQEKIDQADYLAGAMAVMERFGVSCPAWPLMIMSGRDLL